MPVHWQEFSLIPRDLLAQQATTPIERSCINGGPVDLSGSCAAVNLVAPQITAGSSAVGSGTALSSDEGTWRLARAPLTFQRQWLRDDVPILGADDIQYVVNAADRGHRISVRVDATGVGITPGSATSAELPIPSAGAASPTTSPSPSPPPSTSALPSPKRSTPTLTLTQVRQGQPRLRIRVHSKTNTCTGSVIVRGPHAWQRIQTLVNGKVIVRVSKAMSATRARLVIRYRGDTHCLPVKRAIHLRRPVA